MLFYVFSIFLKFICRWAFELLPSLGFRDISVGKESICNAGDYGSIPGSGRFPGEGIGYPLQYSWTSLVAKLVKNPPAMRETRVWSLGWEYPPEKGKATHSSIMACRIPWTVWGCKEESNTAMYFWEVTLGKIRFFTEVTNPNHNIWNASQIWG